MIMIMVMIDDESDKLVHSKCSQNMVFAIWHNDVTFKHLIGMRYD